jgi:hypothetical protein
MGMKLLWSACFSAVTIKTANEMKKIDFSDARFFTPKNSCLGFRLFPPVVCFPFLLRDSLWLVERHK